MSAAPLARILVVDDEPDLRSLLRLCLATVGGYAVAVCASGAEALDHLAHASPDLVLMDVMMPELDGPGTLAALRARGSEVPVVFLTAKVHPAEVAHLESLGALGVIAKPFDPMTLAQQVRTLWETRHG